jgi:hypothetical protein
MPRRRPAAAKALRSGSGCAPGEARRGPLRGRRARRGRRCVR